METIKKDYKKPELETYKMAVRQMLCDSVSDPEEGAREQEHEF